MTSPRALGLDRPVVLADAKVLYANDQRNVLVTLANEQIIRLRWTEEIESEWVRNLLANNPDVSREKIERTCRLMRQAVPDHSVEDYGSHAGSAGNTDIKDRHIAAAAIACRPSTLVTWNLRHFDASALSAAGTKVQSPDAFLSDMFNSNPSLVFAAVEKAYGYVRKRDGRPTWDEYLDVLATRGAPCSLRQFAAKLRGIK